MAPKLEKWVGARGFTSPMIACVLSGTERGEVRVALWGRGCEAAALRSATEATQSPLSPHTEVIRPQEAEPDIADTRPPYHILPRYPPTPHDTTFLLWHPTRRGNRKGWFTYSDMGTEDGGCSRTLKRVEKGLGRKLRSVGGEKRREKCLWRLLPLLFPCLMEWWQT